MSRRDGRIFDVGVDVKEAAGVILLWWKLNHFVYGGGLYLFLSIRLFVFQVVSFPLSVSLAREKWVWVAIVCKRMKRVLRRGTMTRYERHLYLRDPLSHLSFFSFLSSSQRVNSEGNFHLFVF